MAIQHFSPAPPAPAASRPYRRANTGYGKQSVQPLSGQAAPGERDFAFLPERERYVAAYVDHLPDGASMDIKSLAKDLPLYGQMAIGTALRALGVAGHLRRVRRRAGKDGPCRWVTLTFWSRTAHDNEWWTAHLEAAATASEQPSAPSAEPCPTSGPDPVVPQQRTAESAPGRPPSPEQSSEAVGAADPAPEAPVPPAQDDAQVAATPAVPQAALGAPSAAGAPPAVEGPSPAYVALAELGRRDPRLTLSAADCEVLEPLAAAWFARGVSAGYLTSALTAGLPEQVGSPVGLVRRRLTDKMPPRLSPTPTPPQVPTQGGAPGARVRGLLVECTDCGRPARAEALPDGLCAPCRTAHQAPQPADPDAAPAQVERDVPALVAGLRNLMRTP
ncbi:MarR family transcriptional regulator [Streptomyces sp. NBC_00247]|uniref:MarR family transcriptional regulator n=1 Tax=Streptomyces sp. NBC_00247 TaxID=2975689 RepID=UPI002E27FC2D|nr:MarR family transcriptional regulator [Streptomyces sp. NBC_00247]